MRRVRWRVFIWVRAVVRVSSEGSEGQDIAFEEGSMERGRRVNVGSIVNEAREGVEVVEGEGGWSIGWRSLYRSLFVESSRLL